MWRQLFLHLETSSNREALKPRCPWGFPIPGFECWAFSLVNQFAYRECAAKNNRKGCANARRTLIIRYSLTNGDRDPRFGIDPNANLTKEPVTMNEYVVHFG
jgi:hypothetical protein